MISSQFHPTTGKPWTPPRAWTREFTNAGRTYISASRLKTSRYWTRRSKNTLAASQASFTLSTSTTKTAFPKKDPNQSANFIKSSVKKRSINQKASNREWSRKRHPRFSAKSRNLLLERPTIQSQAQKQGRSNNQQGKT